MARVQFRVDLDYDEEMGLHSHLFINEFDSCAGGFNSLSRSHHDPYAFHVMDTLSYQFSSMSLRRYKPIAVPHMPSSLLPLRPKSLSSANNISECGPKADQRLYGERRPKLSLSTTDPFYELHLSRLRKNDAHQDRATVLQRQEARLHKGGLVLRESVGTGVFHPLQRPTYKTFSSLKKRTNQKNRNQSEKELMTKERRIRRGVMSANKEEQQQDECHYHLPSDLDFSKDWTF